MAGLKDIKTRINSVKSTQKITNAMKLVSAAKLARASHAAQSARPYAQAFDAMLGNLLYSFGAESKSPLLEERPVRSILVVVLATDRGLCGGLNSNLFKAVQKWQAQQGKDVEISSIAWGRKAISFVRKMAITIAAQEEKVLEKPSYAFAKAAAKELVTAYTTEEYDQIVLIYPKFVSAMTQIPTVEQLLPVKINKSPTETGTATNFDVEPEFATILDALLERKLVGTIYKAMLEGATSEHGARMSAMDSATRNSKEVIRQLTLKYNRARQAVITTELTEIISGAQALN